jgi:hypothetical protein
MTPLNSKTDSRDQYIDGTEGRGRRRPCAGASRRGCQRVLRRNAGDSASYGGPAGTCGDHASVARLRCGGECAEPQR